MKALAKAADETIPAKITSNPVMNERVFEENPAFTYTASPAARGYRLDNSANDIAVNPARSDAIRKEAGARYPAVPASSPTRAYIPPPIVVPNPYKTIKGSEILRFKVTSVIATDYYKAAKIYIYKTLH
jgi:hypothetical protein